MKVRTTAKRRAQRLWVSPIKRIQRKAIRILTSQMSQMHWLTANPKPRRRSRYIPFPMPEIVPGSTITIRKPPRYIYRDASAG